MDMAQPSLPEVVINSSASPCRRVYFVASPVVNTIWLHIRRFLVRESHSPNRAADINNKQAQLSDITHPLRASDRVHVLATDEQVGNSGSINRDRR
jgi:hypothetical protein